MEGIKKQQWAWAFYDWANSVYSLVITTAIFPIYFGVVLDGKEGISLFGISFSDKDILYSYSITVSFMIVVLISPVLSAISDKMGNKKIFLKIFAWIGALGCGSLYFFTGEETLWVGILGSMIASVGYWSSLVFYNAYLPEIVNKEKQDELSAKGFIYGYIGSSVLLIFCLILIKILDESFTRFSFILVALWWIGFAHVTFAYLPDSYTKPIQEGRKSILSFAHIELYKVGKELCRYERLKYFLIAFFSLSVGVQTIIYMATRFGYEELELPQMNLILTILVIQFVAVVGSYMFSWLSSKYGNIKALQGGLLIWVGICVGTFLMDKTDEWINYEFYILGAFVGLVLGGVQSLSRSTYSKLLPKTNDNATFFSFYDIVEKIALILGSFIFGQVLYFTGSMQYSSLCLGVFFVISILLLNFIPRKI